MTAHKPRRALQRSAFLLMGTLMLSVLLTGCPDSESPRKPPPGPRTPDTPRVPEPKALSAPAPAVQS